MGLVNKLRKWRRFLLATGTTAVLLLVVMCLFDCYYELNDDVLMKDILSGVYTGTPESHNIQMLWLISAFISSFYRMLPQVPWYGFFLVGCQAVLVWVLVFRATGYGKTLTGNLALSLLIGTSAFVLLIEHFVFLQYSITATCMVAAASFLFFTIPDDAGKKQWIVTEVIAVIFVFVAFLIRSEMTLLVLPLVGVTGFARWMREEKPFDQRNLTRYLGMILGLVLALAVGKGTDMIANSSPEWSTFVTLFDNRTELYDFQQIPTYEGNEEFYDSIGLGAPDVALLINYNYGIDERIDENTIGQVADYAASIREENFAQNFKGSLRTYLYRMTHGEDLPWTAVLGVMYFLIILAYLMKRDLGLKGRIWGFVWRISLLFGVRSALWMFLIMRKRTPDRITHSLYLMEVTILLCLILGVFTRKIRERTFMLLLSWILMAGVFVGFIPIQVDKVQTRMQRQDQINAYDRELRDYLESHPDNFYFEDVYSTIYQGEAFNQKAFSEVDTTAANWELLGGWACRSPLYDKKLAAHGIEDPASALLAGDAYLICELENDLVWLSDYYESTGITIMTEQVDEVAGLFGIYRVAPAK